MSPSPLPEPPVPHDCDLRDFAFMPLEVRRMLTSETWVLGTAEEKVAALMLWCEAWHQVPAASLPDNERMLAHLSGAGGNWRKVREHALRGWTKCSDGRLYHPVVAEKARSSWQKKTEARERTAAARAARQAKRGSPEATEPSKHEAPSPFLSQSGAPPVTERVADNVTGSKRRESEGREKGEGELLPPSPRKRGCERDASEPDGFEAWWREYPRREGKGDARKQYAAALKRGATQAALLTALRRQKWPERRFIVQPARWLSDCLAGQWSFCLLMVAGSPVRFKAGAARPRLRRLRP